MKWWAVLLIVIAIGLLGLGGYYFMNVNKSDSNSKNKGFEFPSETSTSADLKFDQPESSVDVSSDPHGPFYHKVYEATSSDGIEFPQKGKMIMDKASVPDVVKTSDGKLYIYAVDGAGRSNSGVMMAISEDNGVTWKQGSTQIKSYDEGMSAADPQAILQDDGMIRLFYMTATGLPDKKDGKPVNNNQGTYMIKSALSKDGINFMEEEGTRYQSVGEQITDPDIIKINNKWYMYLAKGPDLIATVSSDGNTFKFLQNIRQNGSVTKTVPVGDNMFRQYFCRDGISSATSSDGLNWTYDPGVRISQDSRSETICDPSPVKTDDGWLMIYKVELFQNTSSNS